jgi:transposase-like protein
MITQLLFCPYCESGQVIRHGTARGKQRYRCQSCTRTFRENPGSRAYSPERKREILAAYHERSSLRGLRRIFGVSRTTVTAWLKEEAEALPPPGADPSAGRGPGGARTR